ncbi:MAG: PorV/PorQ family protein [Bacteroidia bacterium]
MKKISLAIVALTTLVVSAYAGNPDRRGQAGATELLIVPWARSAGWVGVNTSLVRGIEAERMNVAGLAFTEKTELNFSRTTWLSGSDVFVNAFGLAQRINESSVLGFSVMSLDLGAIDITTTENPDGGLGTYRPSFANIGISYARSFSDRIHGGATVRVITQGISDVSAQGVAFDAGIQYVTGPKDALKFGIALRNVGTPMVFGGDGLSARGVMQGSNVALTLSQRSQPFEMPSLMNIGASYDLYPLDGDEAYRLTLAGNFTSHSFTNDQYGVGAEFSWRKMFAIRTGYQFENSVNDPELTQNVYTGLNMGVSIDAPFGKSVFGLDYAYRHTNFFGGTHLLGIRYTL